MSNLRNRRVNLVKQREAIEDTAKENEKPEETKNDVNATILCLKLLLKIFTGLLGLAFMLIISYYYSNYLKTLHETYLWFSNIKEVEREISFRTESGLYYSFYKQLVLTNDFVDGLNALINDNRTEAWRTINIIERFNIFQEIFLAFVYRFFNLKLYYARVYFYIDSVFALHGVYLAALFATTWFLSRSLLGSLITALFYVYNRDHTTRVDFSAPLRESFALPFIFIQNLFICFYLSDDCREKFKKYLKLLIYVSTVLSCSFWQFTPFVILIQALSITSLYFVQIFNANVALTLLSIDGLALITTFFLQFCNKMILSSFSLHLICASLIVILIEEKLKLRSKTNKHFLVFTLIALGLLTLSLTVVSSILFKKMFNIDADNHIYKFVLSKIGLHKFKNDFETRLYLCHGGFEFIPKEVLQDLTASYLLPIYLIAQLYYLIIIIRYFFHSPVKSNQSFINTDKAFCTIQTLLFALLASTTTRMKYLAMPGVCVLTGVFLSDQRIYSTVFFKFKSSSKLYYMKSLLLLILIGYFSSQIRAKVKNEFEDLREFYDPDTVELMTWISKNTNSDAVFSGSMQLMAGVKLCTGRRLTNHPHFEDKQLRDATLKLYQMYAMRDARQVHSILKEHNTDYIVLEDSICMSLKKNHCGLTQLLDIDNKHLVLEDDNETRVTPTAERFCNEIRHNRLPYTRYFKLVMNNPTFRVYKVL